MYTQVTKIHWSHGKDKYCLQMTRKRNNKLACFKENKEMWVWICKRTKKEASL